MREPAQFSGRASSFRATQQSRGTMRTAAALLALWIATHAWAGDSAVAPPAGTAPKGATVATDPRSAATDPADLGHGLRYLRLSSCTDQAAISAAQAAPALVIDLRLAQADQGIADRLSPLLAHAGASRPIFILVGADTAPNLRVAIPDSTPGILQLSARDSGIATGLTIAVDTAADRAAAEALAAGRMPRELFEEQLEKTRYDEEQLAKDHATGQRERQLSEPRDDKGSSSKPAEPTAQALHDLLLQRAVFIHRGLLALGRIPEHT